MCGAARAHPGVGCRCGHPGDEQAMVRAKRYLGWGWRIGGWEGRLARASLCRPSVGRRLAGGNSRLMPMAVLLLLLIIMLLTGDLSAAHRPRPDRKTGRLRPPPGPARTAMMVARPRSDCGYASAIDVRLPRQLDGRHAVALVRWAGTPNVVRAVATTAGVPLWSNGSATLVIAVAFLSGGACSSASSFTCMTSARVRMTRDDHRCPDRDLEMT